MMQRDTDQPGPTASFGFRDVDAGDKAALVRGVFDNVARRYDLMNDLMSWGVHRLWKAALIDQLKPRAGMRLLAAAGGTGDIALRYHDSGGGDVTVLDVNQQMLSVGRDRALDRGVTAGMQWVVGDAEALPLADGTLDAYTIAFGLRNVTDKESALRSMYRVLKPGGKALILEFSQPAKALQPAYDLYSFKVLPLIGKFVARDEDSYQYLAESIRMHPDQETLLGMMQEAGFERCRYENLAGGIVALHIGYRI